MGQEKRLSWRQEAALLFLISTTSIEDASRASGIPHSTYWRWLREERFQARYRELCKGAEDIAVRRLQQLTGLAADTLEKIMRDEDAPAGSKCAAARVVIEAVTRQRELTEIETRLQQLEAIAAARVAKPVRIA